jgi:two-component system, chemotaxis family, sensor kinase Cph1
MIIRPSRHLQPQTDTSRLPLSEIAWNDYSINRSAYIQSHGILLVLREPDLNILQISDNTFKLLGLHPESLLQNPLNVLLDDLQIESFKAKLSQKNLETVNPIQLHIKSQGESVEFDGIVHRLNEGLLLELEPKIKGDAGTFLDFYHLVQAAITNLNQTSSLPEICQVAAREFCKITECDRAMIYKFDRDGNGSVVAEEKQDRLAPFLGLNYPALDIPEPVRNLFLKNRLRAIADINAQPAQIIPNTSPLDLSFSVLREVSPCHIEYLRNMGVRASLAVSLLENNRLWGLVVCHHETPKYFSYEVRAACEFLGQIMSVELATKEEHQDYEYRLELKSIQSELLDAMSRSDSLIEGLVQQKQNLLDLVSARGAAVCFGNGIELVGKTPTLEDIHKLIAWLEDKPFHNNVFYTNSFSKWEPAAESFKETVSGLLAVAISPDRKKFVLWFRPEILQTVNWAGNPNPRTHIGVDGIPKLSPRKSFELWKETVRSTSLPWKACEIEAALELRKAIINVVLRQADELAELNAALQQSEAKEREKAIQLEQALQELKQTQMQLIHNEKMSSLGQLVAGVAHELNNPVNFISGNLAYANEYAQSLLELVELYVQYYPSPHPEIQEKAEEVELEFLLEDLPKLLNSMKLGAERICKLVNSLRNFSRLDESDMKPVDIHEGIDNTLIILNNRLKPKPEHPGVQTIKEYSTLPLVECHASQLNQVFMNLIANGIDALEERDLNRSFAEIKAYPSTITLRTEVMNQDWVAIAIKDNGPGMPEEIKAKIFDPFFTTKPVGKGTGLGLAISYQIITEKHHGKFYCISSLGEGTEFRIEIPLKAKSSVISLTQPRQLSSREKPSCE